MLFSWLELSDLLTLSHDFYYILYIGDLPPHKQITSGLGNGRHVWMTTCKDLCR